MPSGSRAGSPIYVIRLMAWAAIAERFAVRFVGKRPYGTQSAAFGLYQTSHLAVRWCGASARPYLAT